MKMALAWLLLGASFLFADAPAEVIALSNREGTVIKVEILQTETERIQIRMANSQEIWLERTLLSDESQARLRQKDAEEKNLFAAINTLLGIPLLRDDRLWDDSTQAVAERLGWPRESKTVSQSSFRSYPTPDERILGSRPYSAALYGDRGTAKHLSIVFANKGDFKFSLVPTADEISAMERTIEDDMERIEARLTETLGEPDRQQYGSGRGIKQLIQRWDWKDHSFLLASQEGEYASLKIVNIATADNKGRSERLSDAALRALTSDQLVKRPNGDVLVGQIPMVDQGPKGYCVPATFERYLRYMQIPADMYILAMAGQTEIGGGTSLSAIIESIDGYIASQSRSMKELQKPIKVRTVAKYVDKGLPLIWTMFSSKNYNEYANTRTVARREITDWESWAKHVKSDARSAELRKDMNSAHACLIIGYNKETDEIAVSDSWGPAYDERWISAEQAEQVSQGSIYLIDF